MMPTALPPAVSHFHATLRFPHWHCCSAVSGFRRPLSGGIHSVSDRKVNTFPANSQPLPQNFSLIPTFSGVSKAAPQ